MKLRTSVIVAGTISASVWGSPAGFAQEVSKQPALEEVTVTAERREGRLQDVPIAISTLSASQVENVGILSNESLPMAVPGLSFARQFQGGAPFLRGVGTQQRAPGTESSVAVYIDDVYVGGAAGNTFSFNNIDQIEVLKGPQGTLFGRNATGGVVHIHTRKPTSEPSLDASFGYDNYDTINGSFYGTLGVTDTLAMNLALTGREQHEGWGRDLTTGDEIHRGWDFGARTSALWQPTDRTQALFTANFSRDAFDAGLNTTLPPGAVGVGGATFRGRFDNLASPTDSVLNEQKGASLKIDHDFGSMSLVSISAYRDVTLDFVFDQDRGPAQIVGASAHEPNESYSQELHLRSSEGSKLRWLAGAFYFHQTSAVEPLTIVGASQLPNAAAATFAEQKVESISGFADATYEVLPDTHLTLGGRYTQDDYDMRYALQRISTAGIVTDVTAVTPCARCTSPGVQSDSFPKATYRAVVDHKFTPDIMAYASYSRGFKSGGYNTLAPNTAPVEPEVLDAYEIGMKNELWGRRLRVNASAFYYDYSNLQVQIVVPGGNVSINAAQAEIRGFEAEIEALPLDRLTLSLGLSFLDGEYTEFPNGPQFIPRPAVCNPATANGSGGVQLPGAPTGGNLTCALDLRGKDTVQTPPFTGTLTASYAIPTELGDLQLVGSLYHNSGFYWASDNRFKERAYDLLNLNLNWTDPSGTWLVQLWGRNLLDENYNAVMTEAALGDSIAVAPPRTYGVTFGVHF